MKIKNDKLRSKQYGVSMIETLLVLPIILFLGFGVVHLGLIFQAQSNLEYAALMAARVGAATSIDVGLMEQEVWNRMEASRYVSNPPRDIRIEVLNPNQAMFDSCGAEPTYNTQGCFTLNQCEIPNFGLQYRSQAEDCDGVSIQDANILRIRVRYRFVSGVPFLNRINFGGEDIDELDGENDGAEDAGMFVTAVATVRMQSPARRTIDNNDNIL